MPKGVGFNVLIHLSLQLVYVLAQKRNVHMQICMFLLCNLLIILASTRLDICLFCALFG